MLTREEAVKIVKERDHAIDSKCVDDFCNLCGYTTTEFWAIVDKLYNTGLFKKDEIGRLTLKDSIYNI